MAIDYEEEKKDLNIKNIAKEADLSHRQTSKLKGSNIKKKASKNNKEQAPPIRQLPKSLAASKPLHK